MDVREKLVEILKQAPFEGKVLDQWWWEEKIARIADHLIARGVTVQEWISVKDRLPESYKRKMLVVTYNGDIQLATDWLDWPDGRVSFYIPAYGRWVRGNHWMPRPQPPKGE